MQRTALLLFVLAFCNIQAFEKIVIWGHKLDTHTHSYIHYGFERAFKHLGYPTYWFDDADDVSQFDFSNALFLTAGTVENNIPLREDCHYILHNCDSPKYRPWLQSKKAIRLQVYTDDVLSRNVVKVDDFIYYDLSSEEKVAYMPWATDLLPDEIEECKKKVVQRERAVFWVGSLYGGPFGNTDELQGWIRACGEQGIAFHHSNPWARPISMQEHCALIARSYMAPAIVGTWQKEKGYIPCRIFKNISYGQMGITNSRHTYELFKGKIVYNPDTYQLFFDAQERLHHLQLEELYELMDFVKTKHTYLNRIETLLQLFDS